MRRGFNLIGLIVVIVSICVLVYVIGMGAGFLIEVPFTLAFGWVKYLGRVIPELNPDPWTTGTAVACLAGVTAGSHFFLRWLVGSESQWSWKRTFRGVGLVVLMFVAGIAVVGMIHQTSWLVRSPEPLVEGGVRRVAARTNSANNLYQIGLAADNRLDTEKEFPRSHFNAAGQPMHSWQTALLPYIEQGNLYNQIDRAKPWTHPVNANPMSARIKVYQNYYFNEDQVNGFGASHYAGNVAVVLGDTKTLQSFPAGTSNTILAGEVSANFRAWGDPLNARDPRLGASGHPQGFGGPKDKPAQFAMLDGSVQTFDPKAFADLVGKPLE